VDVVAEGFDLAVRGRTPPDSGLVARPLVDSPLVVVAAPQYLQRAGTPTCLEDLARHECIQFKLPSSGQRVPWLFRKAGEDIELLTEGGLCCSDDVLATVSLACHGGGLLQVPRFMVEEEMADGRLQEALAGFAGRTRAFSLLYPSGRHMPLRVRVLVGFLVSRCTGEGQGATIEGKRLQRPPRG
jgi:DNA-binding transcriptional LysR family regulator